MVLNIIKTILISILVLGLERVSFAETTPANSKNSVLKGEVSSSTPAQKTDAPKEEIREKTLDGEIAGVSPNFIAIIYGQDERSSYEITFTIKKDTRLERIKDIKKLKPGDTVWINYIEKIVKQGNQVKVKERNLKVLRLLNAAKVAVETVAPVASEVANNITEDGTVEVNPEESVDDSAEIDIE